MSRYDWPLTASPLRLDNQRRRAAYNARVRVNFDVAAAVESRRSAALEGVAPSGAGPVWVPLGPTTVVKGQAAGRPRIAGRVNDVWASPDGSRVYAAAAGGGVWYSSDAATTWQPLGGWATTTLGANDRAAMTLSVGCLHVTFKGDPTGADDVVVVGTGELTPRRQGIPGGQIGGVGVLIATGPATVADPAANPWTRVAPGLEGFGIYRIVQDPENEQRYVAASSLGLFFSAGPHTTDAVWQRAAAPFHVGDDDQQVMTDAVWVPRHDGDPARLFVARYGTGVWMSEHGPDGPFEKVDLPGAVQGRLGLAFAHSDPSIVYVLGGQPAMWRIGMTPDGPRAKRIDQVPKFLFGGPDKDQSSYDLALAVNPQHSDVVVLGGSGTRNADNDWDAALVRCTVRASGDHFALDFTPANDVNDAARHKNIGADPTWIGYGVHADVHQIRYFETPAGLDLYIGCDGGVFRSRVAAVDDGKRDGTFISCNSGLAVLEPGYLASHPGNDMCMAIGTQDNGMLLRLGDTVWMLKGYGDGGGVAFHPDHPELLMWQYTGATWYADKNWTKPIYRRTTNNSRVKSEDAEDAAASFYSNPAFVRRADGGLRVALGTNRIWLSDDWTGAGATNNTWVTVPSKEDPRRGSSDDTGTDVRYSDSDGKVVALRWLGPKRLLVLMQRAVLIYREGVDGKWLVDTVSDKGTKCGTTVDNSDISNPSDYLPPVKFAEWSDIAVHDGEHGARGSFYVATTGAHDVPNMDTLWWFDGGLKFHPTGLRANGTTAPAYAVAVDQDPAGDKETVYVGTAVGVWKGVRSAVPLQWAWTPLNNGLPEAAVQDLAVVHHDDRIVLRAAVQSRGVWELDLVAPTPAPQTYLRSWAFDGRRGPSSRAAGEFPPDVDATPTDWTSSPDVMVRPAPGQVPPPPATFPMTANSHFSSSLWAFQTALHAIDPACRPNADWTKAFGRRLEAYRRAHPVGGNPVPAAKLQDIDADVWAQVVDAAHVYAPMWDGREPTEADLLELIFVRRSADGETYVRHADTRVDVMVHHRDSRPLAAADVRMTLVARDITAEAPADWPALRLESDACAAITTAVTTGVAPPMPAPWSYADAGTSVRSPSQPVEARTPRPVTFSFDASGLQAHTILLLAVLSTPAAPVSLAAGTVHDIVAGDPHVAARVLRVT